MCLCLACGGEMHHCVTDLVSRRWRIIKLVKLSLPYVTFTYAFSFNIVRILFFLPVYQRIYNKNTTFCENAKGYLGTRDICGKLHTVHNSMALDSSGQVCFLSPEGKPNTQWWSVCVPQQTSAPTLSSVKSNEGWRLYGLPLLFVKIHWTI